MDEKELAYRELISLMDTTTKGNILVCSVDELFIAHLRTHCPAARIDSLLSLDYADFLCERNLETMMVYDTIIDNGVLEQTDWDNHLIIALGLHLQPISGQLLTMYTDHCLERAVVDARMYSAGFSGLQLLEQLSGGHRYISQYSLFQAAVAWLRSFYTQELRRELAYLLLRVEFAIDVEKSAKRFRELCQRHGVSKKYIEILVSTATVHHERVFSALRL